MSKRKRKVFITKAARQRRLSRPVIISARTRQSEVVDEACRLLRDKMLDRKRGKPGVGPTFLASESGVSTSTLYKMRGNHDPGYSPHLKTIQFALGALGYKLTLTPED